MGEKILESKVVAVLGLQQIAAKIFFKN